MSSCSDALIAILFSASLLAKPTLTLYNRSYKVVSQVIKGKTAGLAQKENIGKGIQGTQKLSGCGNSRQKRVNHKLENENDTKYITK
jgi:hypothetical protein